MNEINPLSFPSHFHIIRKYENDQVKCENGTGRELEMRFYPFVFNPNGIPKALVVVVVVAMLLLVVVSLRNHLWYISQVSLHLVLNKLVVDI